MNISKYVLLFSFFVSPLIQPLIAQQPAPVNNSPAPLTHEQQILASAEHMVKDGYDYLGSNWTWHTKLSKCITSTGDATWVAPKAILVGGLAAGLMAYGKTLMNYSTTAAQATYSALTTVATAAVHNYKITIPVAIVLCVYKVLSYSTTKRLYFDAIEQASKALKQLKIDPFFIGTIIDKDLTGYILKNFNGQTNQAIQWYTNIAQQLNATQKLLGRVIADTNDETLSHNSKQLLCNINDISICVCTKLTKLNALHKEEQAQQAAQNAGTLYFNVNKEAL
jgi:hypothetical protein